MIDSGNITVDRNKIYAEYLISFAYAAAFRRTFEHPLKGHITDGETHMSKRVTANFLNNKFPGSKFKIGVGTRMCNFLEVNAQEFDPDTFLPSLNTKTWKDLREADCQLALSIDQVLREKVIFHLESGHLEGFNAFSQTYRGEMRPVVAVILLNALAAFSLCMYSIYTGARNPAAILNMPSSTSVLCNPALNAVGSLIAGYLADKLVLRPLMEKYTLYKINSILETAYTELDVADKFTVFR